MVQAILENTKTQTRRSTGLKEINDNPDDWQFEWADFCLKYPYRFTQKSSLTEKSLLDKSFYQAEAKCPYGNKGDLLWVRETWMNAPNSDLMPEEPFKYKASVSKQFLEEWPKSWKPSIHMPKIACRLWLMVEDVRCERVQDIRGKDAIAEGVRSFRPVPGDGLAETQYYHYQKDKWGPSPVHSFQTLWKSINGEASWNSNPWVWVVKYRILSKAGRPPESVISENRQSIFNPTSHSQLPSSN